MKRSNRPITSREYKLMLNVDRFENREEGIQRFSHLVEFLVENQEGKIVDRQFERQDEVLPRTTWYLDTADLDLRRRGFCLRLRRELDTRKRKYYVTLKYRGVDRYLSASQDIGKSKRKFEEDVLPPFTSIFAHSSSVERKKRPDLQDMNKVMGLFPWLERLGVPGSTGIETINGFVADEVVRRLAVIRFGRKPEVKACLSFWYLPRYHEGPPLVAEFSFDYDILSKKKKDKLESFPPKVVAAAHRFFMALQKHSDWIDFTRTTKTAYACELSR